MRYIAHTAGEATDSLQIAETSVPLCGANQVLISVKAFGINRADTLQRQGKYPPPPGESDILGLEVCGEVVRVGEQVRKFAVGQRVCALTAGGGYAEFVAVLADHVMLLPERLSFTEGAGLCEVFLTAYQCLRNVSNLKSNQRVLIHGGASGVGLAAIQLARFWGAEVAATASSNDKLEVCKAHGAAVEINYQREDFVEVISKVWPSGVNCILDMVAGDYIDKNLKCLAYDGKIVCIAMLGGRFVEKFDMAKMLMKRATITASTLRNRSDDYKAVLIKNFTDECLPAFARGALKVTLDTVLPIEQVAQAHQRLESNDSIGKLVVQWSN